MPRIESSDVIRGLLWSGPPVLGRELDLLSMSLLSAVGPRRIRAKP
jgi:hypothetical protein